QRDDAVTHAEFCQDRWLCDSGYRNRKAWDTACADLTAKDEDWTAEALRLIAERGFDWEWQRDHMTVVLREEGATNADAEADEEEREQAKFRALVLAAVDLLGLSRAIEEDDLIRINTDDRQIWLHLSSS